MEKDEILKEICIRWREGKLEVPENPETAWVRYYNDEKSRQLGEKYLCYSPYNELILRLEWFERLFQRQVDNYKKLMEHGE